MTLPRLIATLFGIGLLRPAPGTWGSAAAVALGVAIDHVFGFPALVAATLMVIPLGYWATAATVAATDDKDPSEIVIDEVAGQWIALLFPAAAFWWRADAMERARSIRSCKTRTKPASCESRSRPRRTPHQT